MKNSDSIRMPSSKKAKDKVRETEVLMIVPNELLK